MLAVTSDECKRFILLRILVEIKDTHQSTKYQFEEKMWRAQTYVHNKREAKWFATRHDCFPSRRTVSFQKAILLRSCKTSLCLPLQEKYLIVFMCIPSKYFQ